MQLSHTVTYQKENLSRSGQLDEPLFHSYTHVSLAKANGTYHETFHSISGAANFLPDMKKMYSPQMQNWLSLPSKSPSSAFNHTQNQGRAQRKAADKNSFHLVSNFVCPKHSLSIIPLDLILFL